MKLNTKRTVLVGFAFLSICAFWQMYDNLIPKILTETFGMGDELHETMNRVILDNEARVVAGFSPEERELFTSMLLRAIDNMGASACIRKIKEESDP